MANNSKKKEEKKTVSKKDVKSVEETTQSHVGSETKKAVVLLVVAFVFLLCIFWAIFSGAKSGEKLLEEYYSYYETVDVENDNNLTNFANNGINVIYFGRSGCGYCAMFEPVLKSISEEYGVVYHYIDIDKFSTSQLTEALEKANVSIESFGTPTVVLIKDGEAFSNHIGYMEREELFYFFQENGVISEEAILTEENPNLTKINYTQYQDLLNRDEKSIIVIGQTGCGHCTAAKPVLNEIAGEYEIDIYYLNYTDMTTDERSSLQSSLPYFEENESWGTPLNLIVQKNELVGVSSGFSNKQTLVDFFQENGMINK